MQYLAVLLLVFLTTQDTNVQGARLNSRIIDYDHPVLHNFPTSHVASRDENLKISFSAFGEKFDFDLQLNYELVKDAVFTRYDEEGRATVFPAPMIAYFSKEGNTRLTLINVEEGLFEGATEKDGERYLFYPADHEDLQDNVKESLKSKMLIIRTSDIVEDEENPMFCGVRDPHTSEQHLHKFSARYDPPIRDPYPDPPCPTTQKKVLVGIVTDRSYETKFTTPENSIVSQMNMVSQIYVNDVNFQMGVGHVHIGIVEPFTTQCEALETKLQGISAWRGVSPISKDNKDGLYAVFTACYKSGTVGLAWIGVTCNLKSTLMSNGQYYSGTSVSSLYSASSGHLIAAHEFGHNHGAQHDQTGGIMYPSVSGTSEFSVNSQKAICDTYYKNRANTQCFIDVTCTPSCGTKKCGSDGCGGSCGTCSAGTSCNSGSCVPDCVPACTGKTCGADGCGGSCGTCQAGACSSGVCVTSGGGDPEHQDLFTQLHNNIRTKYEVTPYAWSKTLYDSVYSWVDRCEWGYYENTYSANILAWSGSVTDPSDMVNQWLSQETSWDCETDGCSNRCSELRRMLWDDTQNFACRLKVCDSATGKAPGTWTGPWSYLICVYDPPNGWVGERPLAVEKCPNYCSSTQTCSTQQFSCGTFLDNCGKSVNCGECAGSSNPTPTTKCENNKCVCIPSRTCTTGMCGTIDDGCGKTLNCGDCGTGNTCVSGQCACKPTTSCAAQNLECGTISNDGCGNSLSCGNCGGGAVCDKGKCVVPCQPTTSCQAQGAVCGEIDTGCGLVTCGACAAGQRCNAGKCECVPKSTCASLAKECGSFFDGCKDVTCGACDESHQCIEGKCYGCTGCHQMASCSADFQCVCDAGYTGDGYDCKPIQDTPQPNPNGPGNWKVIEGKDWLLSGSVLQNLGTTTKDSTNEWTDVKNMPAESGRVFSTLARRQNGNKNLGLAFNINANDLLFIRWQSDGSATGGEWKLGVKMNQGSGTAEYPYNTYLYTFRYSTGEAVKFPAQFPLETWVRLTLELYSTSFVIKTDNGFWLKINMGKTLGAGVGLVTNGPSTWQDGTYVSTTKVFISLTECATEEELRQQIAQALSVDPATIGPIEIFCAKRQASSSASVVFNSVPGGPNSAALASQFQKMVASGHRAVSGSGLQATSAQLAPIDPPAGGQTVSAIPPSSVSGGGGAGGGGSSGAEIIVPIAVVGGIIVLGAVAAAILLKKKSDDEESVELTPVENRGQRKSNHRDKGDDNILFQAPTEAPEPGVLPSGASDKYDPSKPRTAVDVMGREEATSITARAPAHPKDYYAPE